MTSTPERPSPTPPTPAELRRWRQYLADERAEARVYRELAQRKTGSEREILDALADAEGRHEEHWLELLGDDVGKPRRADLRTRLLAVFARRFGSVFVLALMQRAEARSPYETDVDATAAMAADERIHGEVVRSLAARGRGRLSGTFRAAVFGANDGLVSNLALVLGIGATGVSSTVVLATGVAGLLAGALSMGAGEFVSVRSQRELLAASTPDPDAHTAVPKLDVDANELALVYRARGMSSVDAAAKAADVFGGLSTTTSAIRIQRAGDAGVTAPTITGGATDGDEHEEIGTAWQAAISSFCFFASGAIIPVLPYLFGLSGIVAVLIASVLVGLALLGTGAVVGLLSGGPPLRRALRQLAIGFGAAAVTYVLGLAFGATQS
ncbi:VIT1/CCC1 transporter family protein [Herbiconiux sp. CPCC 205716]|uniref:VIT1/CCC1 transporter family protein n=1 Tax=Herbiconiux gentiana TaxID=2970912 RepID=A0ABT2GH32_9MICO|nr:VIT1/CCC1 transporter family protein [Herbiconiux gentiana]MCS5715537.1 VIT1/CCC1 transporter family protein [Herbiconiux gentiana]